MPLPMIAIVGRPNVGKSSLLNMMAGRRISIVDPTAGVTRDRIQALCEYHDTWFEVVDTGGYGIVDCDDLGEQVEQQIRFAVEQATMILFVVDARQGLMALDSEVAEWLRKAGKPVILLANKADTEQVPVDLGDFHKLGFGSPTLVSAMHRRGEDDLKDRIVRHLLTTAPSPEPQSPSMKIAIVGRRNVGKSTFINALAGQERVIVSEIAGTTRDAVDVRFERDGKTYIAIDTAGIRKKGKIDGDIEFYSFHRAELSIRRADVVLFLLDATADVGGVDKRLGSYIAEQFKPCIVVVNKWDLAKDHTDTEAYSAYMRKLLPGLDYAPFAFVTAKDNRKVQSTIDQASQIFKQAQTRVTTGELNAVFKQIMEHNVPPPKHGVGPVKILYATQVTTEPPTLVMFVNAPSRVTPEYERFLLNRLRERLPFAEVPIRLTFRSRRAMKEG